MSNTDAEVDLFLSFALPFDDLLKSVVTGPLYNLASMCAKNGHEQFVRKRLSALREARWTRTVEDEAESLLLREAVRATSSALFRAGRHRESAELDAERVQCVTQIERQLYWIDARLQREQDTDTRYLYENLRKLFMFLHAKHAERTRGNSWAGGRFQHDMYAYRGVDWPNVLDWYARLASTASGYSYVHGEQPAVDTYQHALCAMLSEWLRISCERNRAEAEYSRRMHDIHFKWRIEY